MIHNLVESDYHLERIRELLSEGIDPNLQDVLGNTPLQTAGLSILINIKIIRKLISAGADVNLVNRTGYTSLHYAALRRKHEMVDALLQTGADINAGTPSGNAALHYAINNRVYEFLRSTCFYRQKVLRIPDMMQSEC
ncbi:hypothetical protein AVEN_247217-1 [Araneus ventricosus]|uniref:Ankyrin repeat domain-containing protein 54 n=1 Tax=Araneus ventricosus TaxID=182803 RepID=A0A4Y2EUC7_ARAVE|nr:hypothetical protein AVEN_247217-1 [Araneus ventricosus]